MHTDNGAHIANLRSTIEQKGFAIIPSCLDDATLELLQVEFNAENYPQRNLLMQSSVQKLSRSSAVREVMEAVLGANCFAVRGIFFNKTESLNWKVVWHQDLTIAVRERRDAAGFGPWSMKGGFLHVQPPAEILAGMLSIRLHLDDSEMDNGPLRVIEGSHLRGRLSAEHMAASEKEDAVTCVVPKGGALVMRPLILHASSACSVSKPRRVIHLEFAALDLPHGLEWKDRV